VDRDGILVTEVANLQNLFMKKLMRVGVVLISQPAPPGWNRQKGWLEDHAFSDSPTAERFASDAARWNRKSDD
jgi:hypothetical protein